MQHTIAAVFDNRSSAQQAIDDLVASGFAREQVRLSEGDTTGMGAQSTTSTSATHEDQGIGASIKNFFSDMFGGDNSQDARMYSEAVSRGNYVVTLTAGSESEVERAADIVERYNPIDIDEHASQWGGAAWAGADALRSGSGSAQQSQGVSQQFQQGSQVQGDIRARQGQQGIQQGGDASATIPIVQEELKIGKREVQRGGVRVYQRVLETPVNESIGLREEHVHVERHAVDQPINPADVTAFREGTFEMRETAEEAVIEKSARVVEEVVVGKDVTQREQQISDTVRRTEVEVEQLSGQQYSAADDDTYFRSHWTSNYGDTGGGSYDDYAPAYRYGNQMASSDLYRGRPWEEVQTPLRSDWEARNPGQTWDKVKAAVRHGWQRITS
ncbi:MAG: YsnF/AvaK domain-containing protein [Pseudomonadota bacterium]